MKTVVFGGEGSEKFARTLARRIRAKYAEPVVTFFPDGELKMKIPEDVKRKHAVFVYSFHPNPNKILIEALFALGAAKQLKARKITLVLPYMGFLRQDKMFHRGEAMSNRIVANLLSRADKVITMDPHLHRISSLKQIFKTRTKRVTATGVIAEHIKKKHKNAIIMGPDEESAQWISAVAIKARAESIVLKKKRYSSRKVKIVVKSKIPLKGKKVVLVDDIISTGHTLIEPIKQLKRMGVKSVTCIGVHGIFVENALKKLKKLGARVETTNTIQNPAAKIDVTKTFAEVL